MANFWQLGLFALSLSNLFCASQCGTDGAARCPYVNPVACTTPAASHFFLLWSTVRREESFMIKLLDAASDLMTEVHEQSQGNVFARQWPLDQHWIDSMCASGYLLAMFVSTKGEKVHSWVLYELGMSLLATCEFDRALFFALFGVTPDQLAYLFFLLSHHTSWPHHIGNPWNPPAAVAFLGMQISEGGSSTTFSSEDLLGVTDTNHLRPLIFDVGMGLGADSRYYLSQGFKVVAVEAHPRAVRQALSDPWMQPYLDAGLLISLNVAISSDDNSTHGGSTVEFYAYDGRPEQSRSRQVDETKDTLPLYLPRMSCGDLLRDYGPSVYMKIDVEDQTITCIESLHKTLSHHDARGAGGSPPEFLSFEVEDTGTIPIVVDWLVDLGYRSYKVCRQSIYSPNACEIESATILGCGAGPFGSAAVDYLRGLQWSNLSSLSTDVLWWTWFSENRDWFDIHVWLGAG